MWLLDASFNQITLIKTFRLEISIVLFLLSGFIIISGVYSFRLAKTTVNPIKPEQASALVTSGIYRVTRNPMYLGFALALFAWAIFLNNLNTVGLVVAFIIFLTYLQIIPEERILTKVFGDEFIKYQQQVRRWI
ncbi:methyltransferase family protein [Thalassotalea ganghwensis]